MICIALYYLCHPGKYALLLDFTLLTRFCLADVKLYIGLTQLDLASAPPLMLQAVTYTILTFTTQKNTVPGEKIGHSWQPNFPSHSVSHPFSPLGLWGTMPAQ